jgi:hypothetical protein
MLENKSPILLPERLKGEIRSELPDSDVLIASAINPITGLKTSQKNMIIAAICITVDNEIPEKYFRIKCCDLFISLI